MTEALPDPLRVRLRALDVLGRTTKLLDGHYWLFFALSAVGWFLIKAVPFGILWGPIACGLFIALRKMSRGDTVEFMDLFRGFERFLDSFLVGLIATGAMLVLILPMVGAFVAVLLMIEAQVSYRHEDFYAVVAIICFVVSVGSICFAVSFTTLFAFPLIVDRGLGGIEALRVALRAVSRNMAGLFRLGLLNLLLVLLGALLCGVGVLFVLPLVYGNVWIAYREMFPEPVEVEPEAEPA